MKQTIITTLVIGLSLLSTITEAIIYKWKDAPGQIHYSSTPPKSNEKNFTLQNDFSISLKSNSTSPDKIKNNKDKSFNTTRKTESQKTSNKKLEFCNKERTNLKLLQKNSTVTWIESGKETLLSGKMLEDKVQVIKESIQKNCTSNLEKNKE